MFEAGEALLRGADGAHVQCDGGAQGKKGTTHRLLSSSFLGLPYRILNMNHTKELLKSLWVDYMGSGLLVWVYQHCMHSVQYVKNYLDSKYIYVCTTAGRCLGDLGVRTPEWQG